MMTLEKKKPLFKQIKKNLGNMSFGLIFYNQIDFKTYLLLTFLDLVYQVIIPLQLAFEFVWIKEATNVHSQKMNFFFKIRDSP
jgi:hypothetical protein